ncbi:MAG: hypothetical protein HZA90_02615 [Verrucomicrobia bacterium]|nr:hypothetical protein [Verrucomicrobiota bacterium]
MNRAALIIFGVLETAALTFVWMKWRTPLYEVYAFYVFGVVLFVIGQWPKAQWLGVEHANGAKQKVEDQKQPIVVKPTTQIKDLAQATAIYAYFNAIIRGDDTHEVCEEIRAELMSKGIAYALLTAFLLFVVPHEPLPKDASANVTLQDLLKAWGAFSAFAILVVWEMGICWLHYRRNKAAERKVPDA